MREAETNVAIKVTDTPGGEAFDVAGRGELQMGVLIENMRPKVLFQEVDGGRCEPIEEVTINVDDKYSGSVIEKLTGHRKGALTEMKPASSPTCPRAAWPMKMGIIYSSSHYHLNRMKLQYISFIASPLSFPYVFS